MREGIRIKRAETKEGNRKCHEYVIGREKWKKV
jgi:hypothetical protein